MKNKVCFSMLFVALCFAAHTALGYSVTVDQAVQRYPWNGVVDIDYTVTAEADEILACDDVLSFSVCNNETGETYPVLTVLQGLVPMTSGRHRITWLANRDGATFNSADVTVTASFVRYNPVYMEIDISGGSTAKSYPVKYLSAPPEGGFNTDEYKGDKIVLRRIHPGGFMAGSPVGEYKRAAESEEQHPVVIGNAFYISIFEVTQKQYTNICGSNPSKLTTDGDYRPVECRSWNDIRNNANWPGSTAVGATQFFGLLRTKCMSEGADGAYSVKVDGFDLPTSYEWEYACRAGSVGTYYTSDEIVTTEARATEVMKTLGRYAGNKDDDKGNSDGHTKVGSYLPNAWGLYDMLGNVAEYCLDYYYADAVYLDQIVDPVGGTSILGSNRSMRGGNFTSPSHAWGTLAYCRPAARMNESASINSRKDSGIGIRLARRFGDATGEAAVNVKTDRGSWSLAKTALDLSASWSVEKPDSDVLKNLSYSSVGWDFDEGEAGFSTKLTATAGTLEDGAFTPGADPDIIVEEALTGRRTDYAWQPDGVGKKLYKLAHTVAKSTTVDRLRTLNAYFDFSGCVMAATRGEVEAAVRSGVGYELELQGETETLWQPVAGAGSGVTAPSGLASGGTSTMSFAFDGTGTLSWKWSLVGGTVSATIDGRPVETLANVAGWTQATAQVDDYGHHLVVFTFTSAGDGKTASLKDVVWNRPSADERAADSSAAVVVDLREGVRRLKKFEELLPFVYSPTNFVGLSGTTAGSVARVSVVQLAPELTDDLTQWTNTIAGTEMVLVEASDESSVLWSAKQGVWRALFEIEDEGGVVHAESAIFDLRKYCNGLMLILR